MSTWRTLFLLSCYGCGLSKISFFQHRLKERNFYFSMGATRKDRHPWKNLPHFIQSYNRWFKIDFFLQNGLWPRNYFKHPIRLNEMREEKYFLKGVMIGPPLKNIFQFLLAYRTLEEISATMRSSHCGR